MSVSQSVIQSVTPVLDTLLLWLWWVMIHIEDFTDVTLVSEDADEDDEGIKVI